MKKGSASKNIRKILIVSVAILFIGVGLFIYVKQRIPFITPQFIAESQTTAAVKFVNSTITADGSVTAQDQASLNFQTSGKLTYLPFKVGAHVIQGQTIASLDTYALQRQLQIASNAYQTAKNNTDQSIENNQAGVLEGQQRYALDTSNKQGYSSLTEATVIYDAVRRIVDNNLLTKNTAQINVDLANYAVQLASINAPINGIIIREDVTVPGVNITPSTTFTVADPDSMIFRANVPTGSIYYISEGSNVTLSIDGIQNKITGTVVKIYPSKVVLSSGQSVYQIDIASEELKKTAKLDLTGRAIISTNSQNVALVPAWTVLSGKYIWVDNNGTPQLKEVTVGKIHGSEIEVLKGLSPNDKIIIDPKYISSLRYQLL